MRNSGMWPFRSRRNFFFSCCIFTIVLIFLYVAISSSPKPQASSKPSSQSHHVVSTPQPSKSSQPSYDKEFPLTSKDHLIRVANTFVQKWLSVRDKDTTKSWLRRFSADITPKLADGFGYTDLSNIPNTSLDNKFSKVDLYGDRFARISVQLLNGDRFSLDLVLLEKWLVSDIQPIQ